MKINFLKIPALATVLFSAAAGTLPAQMVMATHVIAGGGGASAGGAFSLVGTIGQPLVSVSTSAGPALGSGFWTVGLLIGEASPPNLVSAQYVGGRPSFRIAGAPGTAYTIEMCSSLSLGDWTKLRNVTAPAVDQGLGVGVLEFSDDPSGSDSRFYRAVYPAY